MQVAVARREDMLEDMTEEAASRLQAGVTGRQGRAAVRALWEEEQAQREVAATVLQAVMVGMQERGILWELAEEEVPTWSCSLPTVS